MSPVFRSRRPASQLHDGIHDAPERTMSELRDTHSWAVEAGGGKLEPQRYSRTLRIPPSSYQPGGVPRLDRRSPSLLVPHHAPSALRAGRRRPVRVDGVPGVGRPSLLVWLSRLLRLGCLSAPWSWTFAVAYRANHEVSTSLMPRWTCRGGQSGQEFAEIPRGTRSLLRVVNLQP